MALTYSVPCVCLIFFAHTFFTQNLIVGAVRFEDEATPEELAAAANAVQADIVAPESVAKTATEPKVATGTADPIDVGQGATGQENLAPQIATEHPQIATDKPATGNSVKPATEVAVVEPANAEPATDKPLVPAIEVVVVDPANIKPATEVALSTGPGASQTNVDGTKLPAPADDTDDMDTQLAQFQKTEQNAADKIQNAKSLKNEVKRLKQDALDKAKLSKEADALAKQSQIAANTAAAQSALAYHEAKGALKDAGKAANTAANAAEQESEEQNNIVKKAADATEDDEDADATEDEEDANATEEKADDAEDATEEDSNMWLVWTLRGLFVVVVVAALTHWIMK